MLHFNFPLFQIKVNKLFLVLLLTVSINGLSQSFPIDTLQNNGSSGNRIILTYLSDGYQANQLNNFITNAKTINTGLFSQSPFKEYKNFFNAYAIKVPSTDSGAIHPANAADESSSGGQPIANPVNYFKSTFDYASIHRLLVPTNYTGLSNVLAGNMPNYDQAFILVNSPYYGGSGGTYATSSTNVSSIEIAIHEIGHSFAGLADEYWAGAGYAAEKPNMTQNNNPATVKWAKWYGINNISIYPYGSTSPQSTWYRPHQYCKMQYLNYPFCSVCSETFINQIHQLINMIDSYSPSNTTFNLTDTNPVSFSVTNLQTIPKTIKVNWYLNGSSIPFITNTASVIIPFAAFINGNNTLTAETIDSISLSKSYLPAAGYVNSITWTIYKAPSLPLELLSFSGNLDNNQAQLSWGVANADQIKSFELEKSSNGINFNSVVEMLPVAGKNAYVFTDTKTFSADTYYLLKITGKDGTYKNSNIIKLANPFNNYNYKILQNAATHLYHLSCQLNTTQNLSLTILNMNGQEVFKKNFGATSDRLEYDIQLADKPAGIYIAHIEIGNKNYSIKLVAE